MLPSGLFDVLASIGLISFKCCLLLFLYCRFIKSVQDICPRVPFLLFSKRLFFLFLCHKCVQQVKCTVESHRFGHCFSIRPLTYPGMRWTAQIGESAQKGYALCSAKYQQRHRMPLSVKNKLPSGKNDHFILDKPWTNQPILNPRPIHGQKDVNLIDFSCFLIRVCPKSNASILPAGQ